MEVKWRHVAGVVIVLIASGHVLTANEVIEHPAQQPQILNNFVTQLITGKDLGGDATHTFMIENPRNGWLFFRTKALAGRSGGVQVSIQRFDVPDVKNNVVISYIPGDRRTVEAMRFMDKGTYAVNLRMTNADVALLEVRQIPMIIYERVVGSFRGMEGFPEYNRGFLKRCGMFDSINTIGTYDGFSWMHAWQNQGKRAIRISGGIGGLNVEEKAYNHWNSSMVNPSGVNGMIIDEFYPSLKKYFPIWVRALERVRRKYPNRLCLSYTAGAPESLRDLIEPLQDQDFYWALQEQVEETRETHEEIVERGFARNWIAGFEKQAITPASLNGQCTQSVSSRDPATASTTMMFILIEAGRCLRNCTFTNWRRIRCT